MKKLYIFFLLTSLAFTLKVNAQWTTSASPYCVGSYVSSYSPCGDGAWIASVTFGTINYSPTCNSAYPWYRYWPKTLGANYTTILQPGNTYVLNATPGTTSVPSAWGVWIDYNGNNTFEDAELIYASTSVSSGQQISAASITIPTGAAPGTHRMRLRNEWYYSGGPTMFGATTSGLYGPCSAVAEDGETVDFDVTIPSTSTVTPLASYAYDISTDTAWLNSPFSIVNTSNNYSNSYWDILSYSSTYSGTYTPLSNYSRKCATRWNTCYVDTTNQNLTFKFDQVGYYKVKLKVTNTIFLNGAYKAVADSITKIIVCYPPSQKPVASFFGSNRTVGFTDHLNYKDISLNGPTIWSWYLNPNSYLTNTYAGYQTPNTWYDQNGNPADSTTQNPYIYALDGGDFDVCLAVGNSLGWDTLCKQKYLTVNNGYMMCNGTDSVSTLSSGYVYDPGGPNGNYTSATGTCPVGFRIAACADTLYLNMERFKLAVNDTVIIRIGTQFGPIVKKLAGKSLQDSLKNFKIPGGIAFIQMNVVGSSPGDSGFAIHWTTAPASYGKPVSSFTLTTNGPTTNGVQSVYKGYTAKLTSTSTGKNMGYVWDSNGDGVYSGDSITPNPTWGASSVGFYNICLVTYNCVGNDTVCKQIQVLPILLKPVANFTVNKTQGFTTDSFRFFDQSTNGANSWQWSFSPASVNFLKGTNANSQNPIVFFSSVTCYTVSLRATNSLGNNTKTISCMVNVLGYNSPGTAYSIPPGSDIGISRVTLGAIDTSTALQLPVYTQMNDLQIATLYRGVDYTVSTYRNSNTDPMTTHVWLDYNMNALFTDASESIIYEKSQHKIATSQTFRIPDANPTGNTRMRVGISYDSTTLTPDMAQIGCFEDYGINIGIDYIKPVLALNGPAIYKMQVGKTYFEKGVIATDNLEGDISLKYNRTGYLDVNTVGYYTLTYSVSDLYGNTSLPVQRVVQVEVNQTGPSITLKGKDTVIVGVNNTYTDQGTIALDNVGNDISNLVTLNSNVNTKVVGTDSVIYSITDAYGFTATKKRTVLVVDTTAPVIVSMYGNTLTDNVRHQIGTTYNSAKYIWATDNYDGTDPLSQTGTVNVNIKGTYTLTYNSTDASGNHAKPFKLYVKVDNLILPTIFLNGLADMTVDPNTVFSDPGVNYSSAYYAYSTLVVTTTSNLNINKLGTYTIEYCVTDPSNNKACVTRTVHVVDRFSPVINLIGDNPFLMKRFQKYTDPGVMISDNYDTETQLDALLKIDASTLKNDIPGMYYVTYNVSDISGNKANEVRRAVIVSEESENVGIHSLNASGKMNIYPNPNNGKFTIELVNSTSVQTIKVYSVIGALVKEISVSANARNIAMDLSDVNEGIYIVKLDGLSGSITQKINIVK